MLADILLQMIVLHFKRLSLSVEIDRHSIGPTAAVVSDGHVIPAALGDLVFRQHADGIMRETMTEPEVQPVIPQQQVVTLIAVAMVLGTVPDRGEGIVFIHLEPDADGKGLVAFKPADLCGREGDIGFVVVFE